MIMLIDTIYVVLFFLAQKRTIIRYAIEINFSKYMTLKNTVFVALMFGRTVCTNFLYHINSIVSPTVALVNSLNKIDYASFKKLFY